MQMCHFSLLHKEKGLLHNNVACHAPQSLLLLNFEYINNFFQNIVPHQTYIYCRNCHLNVCKAGTVQLEGFYFGLI